jgi:hypothetical protein
MKFDILSCKLFGIIAMMLLLSFITSALSAQSDEVDKRINELESFPSYTVDNTDSAALLILNDSITTVHDMFYSFAKGDSGMFGKITMHFRYRKEEITRTFYMDSGLELFVIVDRILRKDGSAERLTYTVDKVGRLSNVINQHGEDVTLTIDNKQLDRSIKGMFTKLLWYAYGKP